MFVCFVCTEKTLEATSRPLKKAIFQGKMILMIYICLAGVDWKPVFVLFPQSNEVSS